MNRPIASLFLLFILLNPIHPQELLDTDHNSIYNQNLEIVKNKSKSSIIPQDTPQFQTTLQNPINHAFYRFGPAHPSVSDHISTNSIPGFFWIWGESHPQTYSEYIPVHESSACPGPTYYLFSDGPAIIQGDINWDLDGIKGTQQLDPTVNPIRLEIPQTDWDDLNTHTTLPRLRLDFDGEAVVPYTQLKVFYLAVTVCSGKVCNTICVRHEETTKRTFTRDVKDSREFIVEHSEPHIFLLQPIDHEQLSIRPKVDAVYFTNTYAHKLNLKDKDTPLSSTTLTKYRLKNDLFGFASYDRIQYLDSDSAKNTRLAVSTNRAYSNTTRKILRPTALDSEDHNYLLQYYSHTQADLNLGRMQAVLEFIDDYENIYTHPYTLYTRSATAIDDGILYSHDPRLDNKTISKSDAELTIHKGDLYSRSTQKFNRHDHLLQYSPFLLFGVFAILFIRRVQSDL